MLAVASPGHAALPPYASTLAPPRGVDRVDSDRPAWDDGRVFMEPAGSARLGRIGMLGVPVGFSRREFVQVLVWTVTEANKPACM